MNVIDSISERGKREQETERGVKVINNTGEVCNQAGERCPVLRNADPPSSQAYSCHSVHNIRTQGQGAGFFQRQQITYYGSERAIEQNSIGKRLRIIIILKEARRDLRAIV